jgi:opacity protein-like surface antigen
MKKIIKIVLVINLLSMFFQSSFAQETDERSSQAKNKRTYVKMMIRTAPKFTLEFSGYYGFGVFELSANDNGDFAIDEFMKGKNFGVRHGAGANFVLKIPLHERGNLKLNISGMFTKFNSNYSKLLNAQTPGYFVSYNVFTAGIGIENNFTPSYKIKTLAGVGLIGSIISGKGKFWINNTDFNFIIKPAFRLGFQIYSGLEYLLSDNIGLNAGFKFNHINLWLKDSKLSDNPNEIYLNDKKVTPRIPYSGWKQFAWGSIYGGINIYFGIKQKVYIIREN